MIWGSLKDARRYYGVHWRLPRAFEYLMTEDLAGRPPGRYEIDGKGIFLLVQEYETVPAETVKWEAHDHYLDIQYLVSGEETIGVARRDRATVIHPYDRSKDIVFLQPEEGETCALKDDLFTVLFPEDAHRARIIAASPTIVKKAVVKVLL